MLAPDTVEYKDTDTDELRALKSWAQMYLSLPEDERRVYLQEERVADEEQYLSQMIESNRESDDLIRYATRKARSLVLDYEELNDKPMLEHAEQLAEFAELVKADKYTIGDIRKQRERIQWQKMKLASLRNQLRGKRTEPGKSLDGLKT